MARIFLGVTPSGRAEPAWVMLRDLCGEDEEAVQGTDTAQAVALLDRLLVVEDGAALRPGEAQDLTASDRDRLLASVYLAEYGARIDCVLHCAACGAPFDIDFRLPDLMAQLGIDLQARPVPHDDLVRTADGRRLRLPRGRDEIALLGLPPEAGATALLARCLVQGTAEPSDPEVLAALEQAAPILDVDLDATCPECNAAAQARFDLQHYLLATITQESPARLAEIHLLAATYGWSLHDILSLRRRRRRAFAVAIERERGAHAGSA
jgi:hypothetical protein